VRTGKKGKQRRNILAEFTKRDTKAEKKSSLRGILFQPVTWGKGGKKGGRG